MALSYVISPDNEVDTSLNGVSAGNPNNTPALQALFDTVVEDVTYLLPPGVLKFSSGVNTTSHARLTNNPAGKSITNVRLKGAGDTITTLQGNFPGPIIYRNLPTSGGSVLPTGQGEAFISDLCLNNIHPQGLGLQLESLSRGLLAKLSLNNNGLVIGQYNTNTANGCVDVHLSDIKCEGGTVPSGVGIAVNMTGKLESISAFNYGGVAVQVAGEIAIDDYHAEVNQTALVVGVAPGGQGWATVCKVEHLVFESNIRSLVIRKPTTRTTGTAIYITGDLVHLNGASSGTFPVNGIEYDAGAGPLTLEDADVEGSFLDCAVNLQGNGPVKLINPNILNSGKNQPSGTFISTRTAPGLVPTII